MMDIICGFANLVCATLIWARYDIMRPRFTINHPKWPVHGPN